MHPLALVSASFIVFDSTFGNMVFSRLKPIVREAEAQKYMVRIREAISFYVYIVPLGLINIFLHVERDKICCGLQPTRFFLNFL